MNFTVLYQPCLSWKMVCIFKLFQRVCLRVQCPFITGLLHASSIWIILDSIFYLQMITNTKKYCISGCMRPIQFYFKSDKYSNWARFELTQGTLFIIIINKSTKCPSYTPKYGTIPIKGLIKGPICIYWRPFTWILLEPYAIND